MVVGQVGEPAAGQVIAGRYRLEERVGLGGMGQVWRATDTELGRVVAVKRSRQVSDRAARQLRQEARFAAGLQHPNAVTLHDALRTDDGLWLVMEYLPWRSLADLLRRDGPLPPRQAAHLGAQLAAALAALHAAGVVHGDVKPGNVLVAPDGTPKLTDFGLARPHAPAARSAGSAHPGADQAGSGGADAADLTGLGLAGEAGPGVTAPGVGGAGVIGTPGYLAPEVARGGWPGPAADVFSLGATLYAAVVGEPPFGVGGSPQAVVRRAAAGVARVPRRAGAVGPALRAMLRSAAAERPAAERARTLLAAAERQPVRRWVVGAAAAVVAVGLVGAVAGDGGRPAAAVLAGALGEPRTADPCGLVDPGVLARFGGTDEETDYGNFNRCDVLVSGGGDEADVRVELDRYDGTPTGRATDVAGVRVLAQPAQDGECDREVPLPGGYAVYVTATVDDGTVPGSRLCDLADAATGYAAAVLGRGRMPRRSGVFPAGSLAGADACALPGTAALVAAGLDVNQPERGFAGWECRWDSTSSDLSAVLRFDRNGPLDAADDGRPVRLAGHAAYVQPDGDGDGTCVAQVVQRAYPDAAGEPTVELVYLTLAGSATSSQLCDRASTIATAAAASLPPP
jgi:hypothetical protein